MRQTSKQKFDDKKEKSVQAIVTKFDGHSILTTRIRFILKGIMIIVIKMLYDISLSILSNLTTFSSIPSNFTVLCLSSVNPFKQTL